MYALVVWTQKDTSVPMVVGPYEDSSAYDDAIILREKCHKVLVCNLVNQATMIELV